ncbi:CRISPR locus-related DNA-binding protein [Candidatus Woesearchaeota archaeon]|nr:CRISPR locus-related DNA-binding protein [Candidatus Woesearchaeota archaeon]
MERIIYEENVDDTKGGLDMPKVLIATLYSADPVLLAANRLGPDRLILLIDKKPNREQSKNFKLINESLGRVVDVKSIKTEVYDIVKIAKKCVEIIDMQPKDDEVFINLTSGRKTKALGLLYAAYARCKRISKIAYNPEEDHTSVVYLPKLSFKMTDSQSRVLDAIEDGASEGLSYIELAEKIELSRAMLYRNIDELRDMGYLSTDEGLKLTDAGKIARL